MVLLTWREINLFAAVMAGLISGYVMAIAGLWAGQVPGLITIDVSEYGRRYMVSDRTSAWLFGFASHLVNSVLLTLLWAAAVEPNLGLPRPLAGLLWGEALAFTLAGAIVAPLSGLGFTGIKTRSYRYALTTIVLNGLWGLLIGILYL